MKNYSARLKFLLSLMVFLLPAALCAQSVCIMGSSENSQIANDAGLPGYYVSSVADIPEGSNVILLGSIFTAPGHAPLYDLEKLDCKVIRLAGGDPVTLSASIKAYNDYMQLGNSVFADIPKGLGNVNQPVIFPILESMDLKKANKNNTDSNFLPKPLFNTIPVNEPEYIPPALANLATNGRAALEINFEPYSSVLRPDSLVPLRNLKLLLKNNPTIKILVEGHSADDGAGSNVPLSEDRAKRVKQWLVDSGINPSRIRTIGYGSSRPIASNDNAAGQAKNRRIEIMKD
ncbi:MAG TPA: hypothetical protein DCG57_12395 [Candidatus Riflebacteria bacterium]|nr:hypothetical protein [Candidatus Riflebacteria bacterium]